MLKEIFLIDNNLTYIISFKKWYGVWGKTTVIFLNFTFQNKWVCFQLYEILLFFIWSIIYVDWLIKLVRPVEALRRPCSPSPCGSNAVCKERNGAGACSCLPTYTGDPYTGCRPECVLSSDCPRNRACVNNRCTDPCLGTCGVNAQCQVVNHVPTCSCPARFTGNALAACQPIPPCKSSILMLYVQYLSLLFFFSDLIQK